MVGFWREDCGGSSYGYVFVVLFVWSASSRQIEVGMALASCALAGSLDAVDRSNVRTFLKVEGSHSARLLRLKDRLNLL